MKVSFTKAVLVTSSLCLLFPCMGQAGKNLVKNEGFEDGKKHWNVDTGTVAEFKRGYGRSETGGVRIIVTPKRRGVVTQNVTGFVRNQKYEVTAWVKSDRNGYGTLTMDVFNKKTGKSVPRGGFYGGPAIVNKDWSMFRQVYQQKGEDPAQHRYSFVLLSYFNFRRMTIEPNGTGNIWYDDIRIVPAIPEWTLNQAHPSHGVISQKGGKLVYSSFCEPGFIPKGGAPYVVVTMKYAGEKAVKKVKASLANGFITVNVPAGKPGAVSVSITMLDRKSGKKYGEKIMPLIIRKTLKVPPHASMLDEKGRLWINGKKFMPLGVYCNIRKDGLTPSFFAHLDKIRNTKYFNTIVPYGVSYYIRNDKDLVRLLDETHKRNLKITVVTHDMHLFGFMGKFRTRAKTPAEMEKRIKHFTSLIGRHPALLAYYGNDEMGIDRLKKVADGRKLLNKYDPFHPVWGVSYQVEGYHKYMPSVDILAYDTYPVRKGGTNAYTKWLASRARSLTASVWGVPQFYQRDEGVFLTEENTLSPCAVHIIYEARGFIFWTTGPNSSHDKGDMEKRWGMLANVGKTLKDLESFIMSDIAPVKLKVKNSKEEVEAALLNNGKGQYRIVAVGLNKNHLSEISIPKNLKLVSTKFGRIKEKAPGVITYKGGALTCDFGVLVKR